MSLILEALRKSEAERRRGQAPDLATELPPPAPLRRIRVPTWPWLLAASALLLFAAWWLAGPRPDAASGPPADPADATMPAEPAVASAAATDSAAFPRIERIAPPPATAATVASATTGHATSTTADSAAADVRAQPQPLQPAAAATAPAPPPPTAPLANPLATAASDARLPTLAELPAEERRRLPALKLSMHMWNPQPAQRFVILDGIRYGEGDRIGAAVITAIDADGVVLDLNGRALRLPLR